MDSDRVVGTAKKVGGKIEEMAGDVTGDTKTQADGMVDQVKGSVQSAYGQAKDAYGQAKDSMKDATETAKDYADQASDMAGRAYDTGRRYVDQGRERFPEAEEYYRKGTKAVSRQVEESPVAALLVAGALGYLAALLIHGRR